MATVLSKRAVVREIVGWKKRGLFGLGHGGVCRSIIMSMEPGNIVSFREKGRRKVYDVDIESVFNMAVRRTILREQEAKRKAKKEARKNKGKVTV